MNIKKIISIFTLLCLSATGFSQTVQAKTDTSSLLNGRLKIISKEEDGKKKSASINLGTKKDTTRKWLETSWLTFDIGFNRYTDETDYNAISGMDPESKSYFNYLPNANTNDFDLKSKSMNINIGLVKAQLSLYKNYISLVSGITYDINNWVYSTGLQWHRQPDFQTAVFQGAYVYRDSMNTYRKNKLVTNYLQVPFLIRLESSPRHSIKNVSLSAGGYAGYLVRAHTKTILSGQRDAEKHFDEFNLNKFQYGMQFEVAYQGVSLYFKKSLTPLTESGTSQYPYSFGVRLIGL